MDYTVHTFSRPEYWSGQPFPFPGDLHNTGIKPRSPALQPNSLPAELQCKPNETDCEPINKPLSIPGHSKNILFQHTRDDSTHWHHQIVNNKIKLLYYLQLKLERLYTVSKHKTRSWLWLRSWTPYCQIQTYIEESRETRPFRLDLNWIPYNYTVEVTNRFQGLDLTDREPEELWMVVHDIE